MEDIQLTVLPSTGHASEPLELVSTQGVKSLVSCSVLNKPCFVTEAIVAVLPHAVEVGLVLPVVAVGEVTVLIESKNTLKSEF